MAFTYSTNRGTKTSVPASAAVTASIQPSATLAVGKLITLLIAVKSVNGITVSGVTDNSGGSNSWEVDSETTNVTDTVAIVSCVIKGQVLTSNTITITFNTSFGASPKCNLSLEEFNGAATSDWLDSGASNATGSGTALTCGSGNMTTGDLIVAAWATLVAEASVTAGSGYTKFSVVSQAGLALLGEYKLSSTSSESPTATSPTTGTWAGCFAPYLPLISSLNITKRFSLQSVNRSAYF